METLSTTAQDDSSGANPSSVKSEDSSPRHEGGRGSPPPNCAICLGTCRNKSFTDSCLHQFCFKCLLTWSKVKAECPLCKQNFRSIIHNVRSNHQYEEYMVEQRHEETTERIDIDALTATTRRFRYRTTLTLPRRESLAIQQLLVHYPLMADVFPPPAVRAPPSRRRSPASFRRTVYRHNLWARPLPDFTGRFRDCTPEFYRYNDSQMHRLVPWLNRELHYLLNENVGHISYVLTRILELLPQYHINSPEFREAMHRYFGDRTEHFLHELYCFASTPYDMTGYDRNVQYTTDTRISTMVNEVISSSDTESSADSDIVMISHSEPAEPPPGPSTVPAPVYPQNYIPPPVNNVIPIETISHSDTDDDSSEVMVVGYIKPPQDRTPEVVDLLGSDSDVIVQDTTQPEPTQGTSAEAQTPPLHQTSNLVRVCLKRHRTPEKRDSDSESSVYRPPPPRRRRRIRSRGSSTTSDTIRSTPSPASNWSSTYTHSPTPSSVMSTPTSSNFGDTTSSSDSLNRRKRHSKKKSKRKSRKSTKGKKKSKKRSKSISYERDRRSRNTSEDDIRTDRRSRNTSDDNETDRRSTNTSEETHETDRRSRNTSEASNGNDRRNRNTSEEGNETNIKNKNILDDGKESDRRSKKMSDNDNGTDRRVRNRSEDNNGRERRSRNTSENNHERDRKFKRKSRSGKGVKSSKRTEETKRAEETKKNEEVSAQASTETSVQASELPAAAESERAGPSASSTPPLINRSSRERTRHHDEKESKRLRSVVKVMNNHRSSSDSSPSSNLATGNSLSSSGNNYNSIGSIVDEDRTSNNTSTVTEHSCCCQPRRSKYLNSEDDYDSGSELSLL